MKRKLAGLLLAAAIAAGIAYFFRSPAGRRESPPSRPAAAPAHGTGSTLTQVPVAGAAEEPSHLADALNSPGGDIHADLRILDEVFRQFRSSTHGLNPVGENREITAALTGRNRLGFAFIPPGHPAINSRGELCDRWGTPFFFHQLSGIHMEIRSAGPDRQSWNADDEVLTPESNLPQR